MQQRVPFYRRLRFSMILTVLALVALISGTSILISYYVISQRIEKDVHTEILSAEQAADTCFSVHSSLLRLTARLAVEELGFGKASPAEVFRSHEQRGEADIMFLADSQHRLLEASEQSRPAALALLAAPELQRGVTEEQPHAAVLLAAPDGRKMFFILAAVPVPEAQDKRFVFSGYVLDNAFLRRIPAHPRMTVSLVSDNVVLATTLPAAVAGQNYTVRNASSLLPGAIDLIHEHSFFKEKMYMKIKYIPGMENNAPNFLVLAHPSQIVLATMSEFGQHFLILFFVGLCCSILLIFSITSSVLNPISDLQHLVRKISEGDLSDRIEPVVNEFTPLIIQFNKMLDQIKKKDEELLDLVAAKTHELRQQNIFIDNLLRSSQVMAIAATDMDLRVTYFNPVAEKLFGYRADEVIGKKVTQFHTHFKNRQEEFNRLIALALEKGSHTFTISTSDGRAYDLADTAGRHPLQTIEVYLSPIRARKGEDSEAVTGLMLMAQDITNARQMDERLRAALAELQVIIDNTMLGLVLVQNERIVRVNSTFERMFGYAFGEIENSSWPSFYFSVFAGKEANCWDGSGRMYFMVRKTEAGAEPQPFWSKVRQVSIDGGERKLFLFEDMSSQNEMFEKIERLSQAVEQSSNSVVITDIEGRIEYVNRTFGKTTGYSANEVIGKNLSLLAPDDKAAAVYERMRSAVRTGQEWIGEAVNRKKDGELYEENVVVSPIRNEQNEITHFIVTKENISELKKARQQADLANRAKSEFLANMSHEIRTPMNSIIGMTELLLETELRSEQRGYLENVNSSASVLLSLINDILDFSKIEAGRLELDLQPFSLRQLAEEVIETLKILAEQKGIELRLQFQGDDSCLLLGDSLRIRQVLVNLAGNAVKFTRKGHVILDVSLSAVDAGRCSAAFRIVDTGIGISKEQQENIFANFTQADSSITRDYGGTGLGLAISTHLVQMMGGKIQLESELGKGSTFFFALLFEKSARMAAVKDQGEEQSGPSGRQLDILLVEDHPANQQLAVLLLEKQGHRVTVANNGLEALACLGEHRYDPIFMDMQMPVMDGLTATRHIRLAERGRSEDLPEELASPLRRQLAGGHVHIVAVTANAMQEDRQQCLAAGMDNYLSKPYKKVALIKILHQFERTAAAPSALPEAAPQTVSRDEVRQHIVRQFELSQEDADEVLHTYAQSLRENIAELQQCIENGSGEEGGRLAHALKGGLLNLGQERLAKTALLLEKELPKKVEGRHLDMMRQIAAALAEFTGAAA